MRLLVALALLAGCSKQDEAPERPAPPIAEPEVQRAVDACQGYVAAVCACAAEPAREACGLAKALPEAVEIARRLALNPHAAREDALQAADSIRKTVKQCIELTAKLPALGCP